MKDPSIRIMLHTSLNREPVTTDDGYALGDVPSPITPPDVKDIPLFGPGVHAVETRYDLRDYDKVSPVEDQNPFDTCWAFATYGSLRVHDSPQCNPDLL